MCSRGLISPRLTRANIPRSCYRGDCGPVATLFRSYLDMKIDVSNLRSNPFRNLKRLPLNPEKVDALVHSIKDTSFWDNLIGRKVGDTVEVAYGHHRIAALKKAKVTSIDIIVRPLTDTEMVKIMSHENMGEWTHDAEFETETVRATLEAAAAGKIKLPPANKNNKASILKSAQGEFRYTAAKGGGRWAPAVNRPRR